MLAVAGGKGGAGKTTLALGLAGVLARAGERPLVADTDVDMPDLHVLAGADREPTADLLAAGHHVEAAVQQASALPGVGVVAAGRPGTVPAALEALGRWHGPVLVDCPAGAGGDAARPLRVCDRTVLVTTARPAAVEDTRKTAAMARRLGAPPAVALVRGGDSPHDEFGSPVVRVPTVEGDPAHTHPRVRAACGLAARIVTESPPETEGNT